MNEAVGENNRLGKLRGKKWLVRHFTKNGFWKFIGCILSAVTYDIKVHLSIRSGKLQYTGMLVGVHIYQRYVFISIVRINVTISTELFYLTLICSFIGCYFDSLTLYPLQICGFSLKRFK